jgi:hypothetical protein
LWQVTESLLEIRSLKPDNGLATVCYGFGCTDCSPGGDWRLGRGFSVAHYFILQQACCCFNSYCGACYYWLDLDFNRSVFVDRYTDKEACRFELHRFILLPVSSTVVRDRFLTTRRKDA